MHSRAVTWTVLLLTFALPSCVLDWDGLRPDGGGASDLSHEPGQQQDLDGPPDAPQDVTLFDTPLLPDALPVDQPIDKPVQPDSKPLPTCPYKYISGAKAADLEQGIKSAQAGGWQVDSLYYFFLNKVAWVEQGGVYSGYESTSGSNVASWVTGKVKAGAKLVDLFHLGYYGAAWTENSGTYNFLQGSGGTSLPAAVQSDVNAGYKPVRFHHRDGVGYASEKAVWLAKGNTYTQVATVSVYDLNKKVNDLSQQGYTPISFHSNSNLPGVWIKDTQGYDYITFATGLGLASTLNSKVGAGYAPVVFLSHDSVSDSAWIKQKSGTYAYLSHKNSAYLAGQINDAVAKGAQLAAYITRKPTHAALLYKACP